jgi:hypothetical protein
VVLPQRLLTSHQRSPVHGLGCFEGTLLRHERKLLAN